MSGLFFMPLKIRATCPDKNFVGVCGKKKSCTEGVVLYFIFQCGSQKKASISERLPIKMKSKSFGLSVL